MSFSQPGRGDVHVDKPLTNISVAFMQAADAFVADRVFPIVRVEKESDKYFTIPRGHFMRDEMKLRAPGAPVELANYTISTDSYRCDVWALGTMVADQVRANYDSPLAPDQEAVDFLSQKALIRKDRLWAGQFFTTSVWTGDFTGVDSASPGASQFGRFDRSDSKPIETIRAARRRVHLRTGLRPNVLVLGPQVWDALVDNAQIVGRLDRGQTSGPAMVLKQNLAALFELDEILVMDGIFNSAVEGAADSLGAIGSKSALLLYRPSSPGLRTPTAGYTFSWSGFMGASALGTRIKRLRDEKAEADQIEIQMALDYKLVSADLGAFLATAVN